MNVNEYLEQDRQWPHHLRVAYAKAQLAKAGNDAEKSFWREVLKANANGHV